MSVKAEQDIISKVLNKLYKYYEYPRAKIKLLTVIME